jgi:hypothetical protein
MGRLDLVTIIKRFKHEPHQVAALNMLQDALPEDLLDSKSPWIETYFADDTGWDLDTLEKKK